MDFELYHHARLKHDVTYDKYYLFNINNGNHYELTQASYEILLLLENGKNTNDIVKWMSENYNLDTKIIINDIESVLELLLKEKLGAYK